MVANRDRCHRYLNLPFQYRQFFFTSEINKKMMAVFRNESIDPIFIEWLGTLGLACNRWRLFNNEPNIKYNIHVDGDDPDGVEGVFLNFQFGGEDSMMKWYEVRPGRSPQTYVDPMGKPIIKYHEDDVFEIFSTRLGFPSLVNPKIPHTVINGAKPRKSYSMQINHENGDRLVWDDAVKILRPYMVDDPKLVVNQPIINHTIR